MKCECGNKLIRDHVKDGIDYMICVNPKCKHYMVVRTRDGTATTKEAQITTKN